MNHNFYELSIWKKSRILVKEIYLITHNFPISERFGLTSQIQRSAVSVPSNISEGCGRNTKAQLAHFLNIAIGSLCELETQVYLAYDLNYISKSQLDPLIKQVIEVRKMTIGFRKSL